MSELQTGLVFFSVVFGVAFVVWGVKEAVARVLERRGERRGRVVVCPGMTAYLGVLFALMMFAAAALVIPLLGELPALRTVATAFFSLASLFILWRGFVARIVIDDSGVKVVDYLRSHELAWSEIVRIGPVHYQEMGSTLGFETRGKGTISPLFLTDAGTDRRIVEALRRHATVRDIPCDIPFEDPERETDRG